MMNGQKNIKLRQRLSSRHSWTANGGSRFPKTSVPSKRHRYYSLLYMFLLCTSRQSSTTTSLLLSWRDARPQLSTVQPYQASCVWHVLQYSYLFAVWHV